MNDTLRRGLTGKLPADKPEPFVVQARHCGFQPGVDIGRLRRQPYHGPSYCRPGHAVPGEGMLQRYRFHPVQRPAA
ncbi:MAG: hypothetical protein JW760_12245 [Spirochaetales bacterium]|nr:hypothetical protein [Spirochaetales bacterium]